VFTNDFGGARHPEMLEDMVKVGPPKSALKSFDKYDPRVIANEMVMKREISSTQSDGGMQKQKYL
jgi:hypothetical protein